VTVNQLLGLLAGYGLVGGSLVEAFLNMTVLTDDIGAIFSLVWHDALRGLGGAGAQHSQSPMEAPDGAVMGDPTAVL
jgi:hypothetical protein